MAGLLIHTTVYVSSLSTSTKFEKKLELARKVRGGIEELGIGKDALVSVKLHDKTRVAGYISQVQNDSFDITDLKSGIPTTVAYPNVTKVKGHNLSTGAKFAIGLSIGAIALLVVFLWLRSLD